MPGILCSKHTAPYDIIEKLNHVARRLELPVDLKHVQNVLHISQLKKYVPYPDHAIII